MWVRSPSCTPNRLKMKIVKNKYCKILNWGMKRLPFIFFRTHQMSDGHIITMQKWITQNDWNKVDKRAQDLYDNLKFE